MSVKKELERLEDTAQQCTRAGVDLHLTAMATLPPTTMKTKKKNQLEFS